MASGFDLVIYPVQDLDRAKLLFGRLTGVEPYANEPYYVGYRLGKQEIGLDPNGHAQGMTGPVCYWSVDDIQEALELLLTAGAQTQHGVRDVGGGKLVASVRDPDGNTIALMQSP